MGKKFKSSMKTEAGVGDACPRCARPMQRWKHAPAWAPVVGRCWYEMWDECLHKDCRTTLVMPSQFLRSAAPAKTPISAPAPSQHASPSVAQLEAANRLLESENAILRKRLSDAQRTIHGNRSLMREECERLSHMESIK